MTDWAQLEASVVDNDAIIWLGVIVVKEGKEPIVIQGAIYFGVMFFGSWSGGSTI